MMTDEIDPMRLHMKKFTRYNIHENEFHSWAIKPIEDMERVFDRAGDILAQQADAFCDSYEEDKKAFQDRADDLKKVFSHALTELRALTSDNFRDHVGDIKLSHMREGMALSRDMYNKFWAKQVQCYIDNNGEDDAITEFNQYARDHTLNLENEDSMLCNYTRLHNRVRYWQFVPLAETRETKDEC